MNLKYFIDRPVLSAVISITIVLMGLVAIFSLPVEQYPDIAPPTISVSAYYPGASAETAQKAVVVPLKEAINGVENMNYITSTAANGGDVFITVYFKQGTDADMAAVNVQNRVSTALGVLPSEVVQIGVTTTKQQNSELKTIALYSPDDSYDMQFLNNYMKINVEPRIKRIAGVGKTEVLGSNYSMRIWLKPDVMAQYKLIPSDITSVLQQQNIEAATGAFGENHPNAFQYTMKYRGRYSTPKEFGNIVVRALPGGEVLHLREVADIQLGDEAYSYKSRINSHPGSVMIVYQTAGSNASSIIQEIDDVMDAIAEDLPKGIGFVTLIDTNEFLYASIEEVIKSLLLAIVLVVLVVYFFLQDIRATLIPTVSIIVSIIGTFAFMAVAGFSINLLTLFALVLAIGTVVDDAIVVVEAVQARFDAGYRSSHKAASDAMKGIASAIFTSTLIFMAVFIPVSMMGGTSGAFYTQFGITMAVAVGISAINAFTLSPALCALLMKPYKDENGNEKNNFAARFRKAFNASFTVISGKYTRGVLLFIKKRWLMWGTLAVSLVLLVYFMRTTPTGLIPDEDTGTIMVSLNTPSGTSLHRTSEIMDQLEENFKQMPEIEYCAAIPGFSFTGSGPSYGMFMISLKDWGEREKSIVETIYEIYYAAADIPDAQIFATTPPMIAGYGMSNGFDLYVQDKAGGDVEKFKEVADAFIGELNKRPEIEGIYSQFAVDFPQYMVDVDAAKCEQAGVTPAEVLATLADYYGGGYISNFNRFSKLYRVMIQASPEYRVTPESLDRIYVRVGEDMAPLSQFVTLTKTYGPQGLDRFNLYNSITLNGSAAIGYSSGDALHAIEETAQKFLPRNYGYEFGGISREESGTKNNTIIIFALCLVLVYLILSALYESFWLPLAIVISIPCGLMGSFFFAWLIGLENNIYMQTGLIMLIGLLAKTAILLTEYATTRRQSGMGLVSSALNAAKVRLRPILMTALTMIFGLLPLLFATGVGAYGSFSLATGAVGGMLVGTVVILFLVPGLFVVFQYIQEKFKPIEVTTKNDKL